MNIYISVDMEGIAGIVVSSQTLPGGAEYTQARRLMVGEVNAAIEGALQTGAKKIVINDAHHTMTNIDLSELNPNAILVSGQCKPLTMMEGINGDFSAALFIGYHSGAGVEKGVLGHSYLPASVYREVRINGVLADEAYINGALAGHFGVPVRLVSGDYWAINKAKEYYPDVEVVETKTGHGMYSASLLHPRRVNESLRNGVKKALAQPGTPLEIKCPVTFSIRVASPAMADIATLIPIVKRCGSLDIEFTIANYLDAYRLFTAVSMLAIKARNELY